MSTHGRGTGTEAGGRSGLRRVRVGGWVGGWGMQGERGKIWAAFCDYQQDLWRVRARARVRESNFQNPGEHSWEDGSAIYRRGEVNRRIRFRGQIISCIWNTFDLQRPRGLPQNCRESTWMCTWGSQARGPDPVHESGH